MLQKMQTTSSLKNSKSYMTIVLEKNSNFAAIGEWVPAGYVSMYYVHSGMHPIANRDRKIARVLGRFEKSIELQLLTSLLPAVQHLKISQNLPSEIYIP